MEIGFKDGLPQYAASPLGQGVAFDGKLSFDAGKAATSIIAIACTTSKTGLLFQPGFILSLRIAVPSSRV